MSDKLTKPETSVQTTPAQLLELAINKDLDVDKLRSLMEMQREWQAQAARKEFFNALMAFQADMPEIRKSKRVSFTSKTGGNVDYNYAPLADIVRQVRPQLRSVGLSFRWEMSDTTAEIKVTFLVTHIDGHTERTTMGASPDTSGLKNPIQARGSTIEYLKRYTLIGGLGLSTTDSDIDGRMPDLDIDKVHAEFLEVYNQLIQIDSKYTQYHVDNWKGERSGKNYVKAISELRRMLHEEQKHK